jgi:hypothetical protein
MSGIGALLRELGMILCKGVAVAEWQCGSGWQWQRGGGDDCGF